MNEGVDFYENLLAKGHDQHSRDYDALEQGPDGTMLRHRAVVAKLGQWIGQGPMLDLGCGTGLLLDSLQELCVLPKSYTGVDFIQRDDFFERARRVKIDTTFVRDDVRHFTESVRTPQEYTTVIAAGLVGMVPFQSLMKIKDLVHSMRWAGQHGIITIPSQHEGFLGCAEQAHFAMEDARAIFAWYGMADMRYEQHSPKEFIFWW